jgi:glycosyltransferase involved in cell wall biosynthesis
MNILMSYNTNEGHGAIGRYRELTDDLLKIDGVRIFYISPEGHNGANRDNFFHLGYKKRNFKPNFIYAWLMICAIFFKNIEAMRSIDKCILFNGANSFVFAIFKSFFKYELTYSVRVNIIVNQVHDNNQYSYNYLTKILKKIQFNFYNLLERFIVRKSDKIVFQSSVNAKEYKKMYNVEDYKIHILRNNCNPSWVGGKTLIKLNEGFNIAFVGNIFRNKGLRVLINSFALVNKKIPNSYLTIIGDGPDKDFFEKSVKELSLKNVNFIGYIKNAPEVMHNFDLIIVPSFMEAFPNVILEAIYYKVPVLGSRVGGIPLILNEEFLFESNNHEELFKKIVFLSDKENHAKAVVKITDLREQFLFDWGRFFYDIVSEKNDT